MTAIVELKASDLNPQGGVFCPSPLADMKLWSGHPKVYLEIDEHGYVDCGYCDRRFVLEGGPADGVDQSTLMDISEGGDPGHR